MYIAQPTHQQVKLQHALQQLARGMRSDQTSAEQVLWARVRKNQLGFKFRRQYPLYQFIVDFYCSEAKLIIEVDGPIHNRNRIHDQVRDDYLLQRGYVTIRFTNSMIMTDILKVIKIIKHALPCKGRVGRGKPNLE